MKAVKGLRFAVLGLALVALLAFSFQSALAQGDGTFNVSVYHGINGRSLDLSKDLPVDIEIWKDGGLLAKLNDVSFKDRITTALPEGEYEIRVFADDLGGAQIDSMTVGPVYIPEGVDVRLHARLGAGQTPMIMVKVK